MADAPPADDELTVYLVRWAECWHHRPRWQRAMGYAPLPGGGVLKAFADPAAAEAFRADAERDARRAGPAANPFAYSEASDPDQCLKFQHLGLGGLTSLPEPVLRDWLQEAGFDPPPPHRDGFGAVLRWGWWWERFAADMTPDQRAKAWEAFDKVRLFEVVKVPPDHPPGPAGDPDVPRWAIDEPDPDEPEDDDRPWLRDLDGLEDPGPPGEGDELPF